MGPLQANFYLAFETGSGAAAVIDPGGDPEKILAAASRAGVKINAIFISHGHGDHLGAAPELAEASGAPIYGSAEVKEMLAEPGRHTLFPGMPEVSPARVDRVLSGGENIAIGGMEVSAIATPGHSRGSLTYFATSSLFCGDLLFHGSVGRTDLPGGSFEELAASVKKLILAYPPETAVFPGHGNATTLGEEKEHNLFLTGLEW